MRPGSARDVAVRFGFPVAGGLFVARTSDGGGSWETFREGLPRDNAYGIISCHALDLSGDHLCFGTATGDV